MNFRRRLRTGGISDRYTTPPGDTERCIPQSGVFAFADLASAADAVVSTSKRRGEDYVVSSAKMDRLRRSLDVIRELGTKQPREHGGDKDDDHKDDGDP